MLSKRVTPFVGVWIEVLPDHFFNLFLLVTPFVGVWIEVLHRKDMIKMEISHSLRGSVD